MNTRLVKNWVTTSLGLILLYGAWYMLQLNRITWGEFVAFVPTCLILFRAKDSLIWSKAKE